ncbi:uncharacterized protein [Macaca nemestrina]|uniref:uncharacterized protein isoform X2 n=1 Tax=Macaca nemestrina TaxID=9545 RepID=UPI0039B98412
MGEIGGVETNNNSSSPVINLRKEGPEKNTKVQLCDSFYSITIETESPLRVSAFGLSDPKYTILCFVPRPKMKTPRFFLKKYSTVSFPGDKETEVCLRDHTSGISKLLKESLTKLRTEIFHKIEDGLESWDP